MKCGTISETVHITIIRDLYFEPVPQDITLGVPEAAKRRAQMRTPNDTVEAQVPSREDRLHLALVPSTFGSPTVRGMEAASTGHRN